MSCRLPPAPFPRGPRTPPGHPGLLSPGFRALLLSSPPPPAASGRYPELGVPFPDWVPFGSPGRSRAWPGCPRSAGTGGRLRLGRDEVPAAAHRLRVLSKLGDGRGRAGTDGDICALLGPLHGGRRGRWGLGFYRGPAAAGLGRWIPKYGEGCERREREQGLGCLLPPHSSWEEKGILWSNFSWSE